ncbi:MAG TPA: cytochrome c3 family protein, partial [Candidatus Nitrosotenuis sp.]|nr:cytochrome c3 family protein [Candidatus Nitrosotenuis sp.]
MRSGTTADEANRIRFSRMNDVVHFRTAATNGRAQATPVLANRPNSPSNRRPEEKSMFTRSRPTLLLLGLVAVSLLLFVIVQPLAAGRPDKTKKVAPVQDQKKKVDPSQYIGADACKACHEPVYTKFETTVHWKTMLDTKKGPEWQGCEACHGPGAEHMGAGGDKSKIFNFKGVKSREISARCMECHQFGEEHSNFNRTAHAQNDVSCVSCHSVHNAKQKEFLLTKASQAQLCY